MLAGGGHAVTEGKLILNLERLRAIKLRRRTSVNFVQSHLIATVTNWRREEDHYLYVYGTLENTTNAAFRWVGVTVTAYNRQKQVVNDRSLFPSSGGYIQSGQTLNFSTMISGENDEIYHIDAAVDPVDNTVLNSALFQ